MGWGDGSSNVIFGNLPPFSLAPANDPSPPANDQSTPQEYMSRLSDPDLVEMHSQDVDAVGRLQQSLRALNQLQAGRPPSNYDEAQVVQSGIDDEIARHSRSLNEAQRDVALRVNEMQRRGLVSGGGIGLPAPEMVAHPGYGGMLHLEELYRRFHESSSPYQHVYGVLSPTND